MSPQCLPLSVEKSMPHWLNPTRLSFWPAVRCVGLDGSNAMSSSAWRRKVQSWLTRLLPLPLSRLAQPSEPGPEPVASPARPKSAPDAASAATSLSSSSLPRNFAAMIEDSEMNGICFVIVPFDVCTVSFAGCSAPDAASPITWRWPLPPVAPPAPANTTRPKTARAAKARTRFLTPVSPLSN